MIAGVWFSFSQDWLCLRESVAQFRAAFPDCPVCIFDDARAPTPASHLASLNPDLLKSTNFDRGGAGHGWDAIKGILASCHMATEKTGAVGTLKIDCDTLVLRREWLDMRHALDGWHLGKGRYAAGMARYLRADVPASLLTSIESEFQWPTRVPEDQTISIEALWHFPQECRLHPVRPSGPGPRAGAWHYRDQEAGRPPTFHPLHSHSVLTFGNRTQITQVTKTCERREWAGLTMARIRRYLSSSLHSD